MLEQKAQLVGTEVSLSIGCDGSNSLYRRLGTSLLLQSVQLRKENEVLRRNISALYNTAKNELGRRDTEIADLRRQVRLFEAAPEARRPDKEPPEASHRESRGT